MEEQPAPAPRPARLLWLLPILALLAGITYASLRRQQPEGITRALAQGRRPPAPEFRLPTFEGGTVALSDLRGKYVVMNFWASWCVPCKDEAPLLERVWRENKSRDLVVLGVNIQDLELEARRFIVVTKATYPQVRDRDGRVSRAYATTGIPETFFINREGRIVRKFTGAALEWADWESALRVLMDEP